MSESIEELRKRWEDDPSPQLSLQLAEEYRRLEQPADAAGVLTRALEEHPGHVAARVALGRFRFEMGDLDEACGLLERVVNEDPTHLVASKLLVSLYLERGDRRQARDRLDLYKVLNEGDPEIEQLESRLSGGTDAPAATVAEAAQLPGNGDPFKDLWADLDSAAYWQAIAAQGVFPVTGRPSLPESSGPSSPVEESAQPELPATTVTLGNLFLEQGHLEDAEQAYGQVLEKEPDNTAAQAGMEEVERQRTEDLEMAAEGVETVAVPMLLDANGRKIEALKDYLRRIRAAGNR